MNAKKATINVRYSRTFGLIVGCAAMLSSVQAYALGLGGFQVQSTLDQPLRAEIQLQSVDPETLESLRVTLGSSDDFRRADVPRSAFLQSLQFEVVEESGGPVVVVTTDDPVKEPFLHFLVSVQWSGGKLIREYTGLLDPPLYATESPESVEMPAVSEAEPAEAPAMTEPEEMEPETAEAESQPATGTMTASAGRAAEYGPTQEGDTLWDIASKLDTGPVQANVFQVMIALQRENPDAFIDGNVNRLRTGQVLSLQDISAVASISPEEASVAYTAQLEQWRSYTEEVAGVSEATAAGESSSTAMAEPASESADTADAAASDQAAAEPDQAQAEAQAQAEGQDDVLRIVQATVDESEQSQAASAGADRSGELAELQGRIATLEESLESRNLENEELRERVRLLESQLENAQRLVEIESQELAAAQQQAAEAQAQAEQARQQAAEAEAAAAQASAQAMESTESTEPETMAAQEVAPVEPEETQQETQAEAQVEAQAETQETASASAAAESEAESQQTQQSQQAQQASAADQSGQSSQPVRTVSSRPPQGGSLLSDITDMLFSSWMWMVGAGIGVLVLVLGLLMFLRRRQSIAEFEESILSGSALDSYSETTDTAGTSASDTSFLSDFGTAGMGTMQADEVDPLAEAEVYLAYGRDEQAEDVLKEAARRDPERAEVKLKLLEIYKQRNDVKSFETIAEELYPAGDSGDQEIWSQVTAMGRELNPDNPLFQESGAGAAPAAAGLAEASPEPETQTDAGAMDFDLDELGPSEPPEPAPAQPSQQAAAPETDERSLDELSVNLDTGPGREAAPSASTTSSEDTPDFDDEFMEQASRSVDPATQPFPAPDQQSDLDQELDRLASERETVVRPAADAGDQQVSAPDTGDNAADNVNWERADSDAGALDFPSSDASDIDFDLNLDDSSIQRLSGAEDQAASTAGDTAGASDDSESVLEFESEDIPPEETWAGPSSDATPGGDEDSVSYSPSEDVQSAGAPQYNEAETKLDLARAYLDMGDKVGARSIIDEVMREGDPAQRDQAAQLAAQL